MTNISTAEQTSMDIFRVIMDYGPLTLYSTNSKTRISIGTIHRHLKQLKNAGKIKVYEYQEGGRRKIKYGPTIYGMISAYRQNPEFAKKTENYFLIWIEHKEFRQDLGAEGFDTSLDNLKRSKHVFKKYMDYFSAVEQQIEKIKRGEGLLSHEMLVFFSSMMMLSSDVQYQKLWTELYNELPGMQKNLDQQIKSMVESYQHFKDSQDSIV